jgi:uncharacterized membrane protein
MHHLSLFEIIMLVCFGASWPFSIYRTWRSKTSAGKSLVFLILVLIGYVSGVLHKALYSYDPVIYLYLLNGLMVAADLALAWRYRPRI